MERVNEKKRFRNRWIQMLFLAVVIVWLFGITTSKANSQSYQKSKVETGARYAEYKTSANQGEKLTVWRIIQWNDFLLWPFIILTAVGLLLVIYQGLAEHREKKQSQMLLQTKFRANEIRTLVQMLRTSRPNRATRLLYQIISTFDKTKQAEPIGDDINQFLAGERDSFETINRIVGFLSETAGALGLLGTVWGIFITFHSGNLDGAVILQGMSIALVTTITGLVISLLLNTGSVYAFTLFNRHLALLSTKAEELRQVLLILEKRSVAEVHSVNENVDHIRVVAPEPPPRKETRETYPAGFALAEV